MRRSEVFPRWNTPVLQRHPRLELPQEKSVAGEGESIGFRDDRCGGERRNQQQPARAGREAFRPKRERMSCADFPNGKRRRDHNANKGGHDERGTAEQQPEQADEERHRASAEQTAVRSQLQHRKSLAASPQQHDEGAAENPNAK